MEWYYVEQGQQIGPITDAEFARLKMHGKVTSETLVWHSGMPDWQPYEAVAQDTTQKATQAFNRNGATTTTCTECGGHFATSEMLHYGTSWVCAGCKRVFFQKVKEGVPSGRMLHYAGFWIRVGAKIIDGILLSFVNILINSALGVWLGSLEDVTQANLTLYLVVQQILSWGIMIAYATYFIGKYGATLGKMACRLQVVTPEGGEVGTGRAFGRFWAELLSSLTLGIGYLMVVWDGEKRALHDRLCHTRVVRRN